MVEPSWQPRGWAFFLVTMPLVQLMSEQTFPSRPKMRTLAEPSSILGYLGS